MRALLNDGTGMPGRLAIYPFEDICGLSAIANRYTFAALVKWAVAMSSTILSNSRLQQQPLGIFPTSPTAPFEPLLPKIRPILVRNLQWTFSSFYPFFVFVNVRSERNAPAGRTNHGERYGGALTASSSEYGHRPFAPS